MDPLISGRLVPDSRLVFQIIKIKVSRLHSLMTAIRYSKPSTVLKRVYGPKSLPGVFAFVISFCRKGIGVIFDPKPKTPVV